jgi:aminoglycoside phosphotransferase (APT) family kinase protein
VPTCAEGYLETVHRRFQEDLVAISACPPPFVLAGRLEWMHHEVSVIEAQVRELESFDEPASSPTHGDVWLNNVLVTGAGLIYLLDWDGLGFGDPAMDWAMLYGPNRSDLRPVGLRSPLLPGQLDAAARERLQIWGRATLLDWVIDPLADWIEAASEPEHGDVVRTSNRTVHERALAQYLALWGPSSEG